MRANPGNILQQLCCGALIGIFASTGLAEEGIAPPPVATEFQYGAGDLLLPKFTPESQSDSDLGVQLILQSEGEYEPLTLSAFTGYYFTDNANLSASSPVEDHVFTAGATVSYLPMLGGNLYGEATVRDQVFLYNQLDGLDFNALDLGAGLVYVVRSLGDASLYARYNYAHFTDPTVGGIDFDNYQNHSIQAGVYKGWILARNHFTFASWRSDVSLDGDPGYAQRDDHSLTVGYRWTPAERWKLECFYRAAFLDFEEGGREDWNHASGGSITYNFTRHLYLSAFLSYTDNDSSLAIDADYQAWQPGVLFGGNWKF